MEQRHSLRIWIAFWVDLRALCHLGISIFGGVVDISVDMLGDMNFMDEFDIFCLFVFDAAMKYIIYTIII